MENIANFVVGGGPYVLALLVFYQTIEIRYLKKNSDEERMQRITLMVTVNQLQTDVAVMKAKLETLYSRTRPHSVETDT